jgi:hypothetical protein
VPLRVSDSPTVKSTSIWGLPALTTIASDRDGAIPLDQFDTELQLPEPPIQVLDEIVLTAVEVVISAEHRPFLTTA